MRNLHDIDVDIPEKVKRVCLYFTREYQPARHDKIRWNPKTQEYWYHVVGINKWYKSSYDMVETMNIVHYPDISEFDRSMLEIV